jgi:hypothetical protein
VVMEHGADFWAQGHRTSQGTGLRPPHPGVNDFPSPTLSCPASTKLDSSPVLSPGNKAKPDDHRSRPGRPAVSHLVVAWPCLIWVGGIKGKM